MKKIHEFIVDYTLLDNWWKAIKYMRDTTIFLGIDNYYLMQKSLLEQMKVFVKHPVELADYEKEQSNLLKFMSSPLTEKCLNELSYNKKTETDSMLTLNTSQNLNLIFFRAHKIENSSNVAKELCETLSYALHRRNNNEEIQIISEDEALAEINKENNFGFNIIN